MRFLSAFPRRKSVKQTCRALLASPWLGSFLPPEEAGQKNMHAIKAMQPRLACGGRMSAVSCAIRRLIGTQSPASRQSIAPCEHP